MEYKIPYLTLGAILLVILLGVVLPSVIFGLLKKKYRCASRAYWTGMVCCLFFVYFLESLSHSFILPSGFGTTISGNFILSALYGAVMAVIFQEGGKWFAFRSLLPVKDTSDADALMFASGFACFEWLYGLIFGMMGNLTIARALLTGNADVLFYGLDEAAAEALHQSLQALCTVSPLSFLMAPFERLVALILQIGVTVIFWFGLKNGRKGVALVAQALGIRFCVEFLAGVLSEILPIFQTEVILLAVAVFVFMYAYRIWRNEAEIEDPETDV